MSKDNPFSLTTSEPWKTDWLWTLVIKLCLAFFIPFFADEAYYWVWSQNLQLSYFDHPPMVAWLFKLGLPFDSLGYSSRWPFIILSHLTIFIWCQLLAKNTPSINQRLFFWVLLIHPLIGLGGFVANPDVPFLFFWSLSLWAYFQCLEKPTSLIRPILLGALLGLGFCSKYLMVLVLPPLFLHLTLTKSWRSLRHSGIFLVFISGLVFSLPVLIWNYQNDWVSMNFQLNHGLGKTDWNPKWTLDFILGTSLLLFPPFLFYFFKNIKNLFLEFHTLNFLTLFVFFFWTTFRGDTELNWPIILYPSFFYIISQINIPTWSQRLYLLFFGFLFIFLVGGTLGLWGTKLHGRLAEGLRYKSLYQKTQEYRPLLTSTYQTASYFWYLSKSPIMKLSTSSRPDHFDLLPGSTPTHDFFFLKESYQIIPKLHESKFSFTKIVDLSDGFELYRAVITK